MLAMEKQLASLSSLVHQALATKQGTNTDTLPRDYETMRREILNGGGAATRGSDDTVSDAGSVGRMSGVCARARAPSIYSCRSEFHVESID
jgi:hypothetical protein